MYGMYLLHKEELQIKNTNVEEKMLYHATSSQNAISIASNNIDWRKTQRSRFGKGACFSKYPNYANKYSMCKEGKYISKILNFLYICFCLHDFSFYNMQRSYGSCRKT